MQVNEPADSAHLAILGDVIRVGRLKQDLTVARAASLAAISQPTWGAVEHGKAARPSTYQAIGRALRVRRPELVQDAATSSTMLDALTAELNAPQPDLTTVPHSALLAELDRRLSRPGDTSAHQPPAR